MKSNNSRVSYAKIQIGEIFEIGEPLLTQFEAATLLHIEPRTLESWRQNRSGPRYIRYSRRCVRYRVEDLREWLKAQAVEAVAAPPMRQ